MEALLMVQTESRVQLFLRNWLHFIGMSFLAAVCAVVALNRGVMVALLGYEIWKLTKHQIAEHRDQFFAQNRRLGALGYAAYIVGIYVSWHENPSATPRQALGLVLMLILQAVCGYGLVDYVWHDWMHDRPGRKPVLSLASVVLGLVLSFGVAVWVRQQM